MVSANKGGPTVDCKILIGLKSVLLVRTLFLGTGAMSAHLSSLAISFIVLYELTY